MSADQQPAQSERKIVMLATLDNALELAVDAGATHEEIAEAVTRVGRKPTP